MIHLVAIAMVKKINIDRLQKRMRRKEISPSDHNRSVVPYGEFFTYLINEDRFSCYSFGHMIYLISHRSM